MDLQYYEKNIELFFTCFTLFVEHSDEYKLLKLVQF